MDIDWTAIGEALRAPFPVEDVEFKPGRGGGKALIYVDARAVQDRLDAVVGPGHWAFDWQPLVIGEAVQVVKGTLTIHGVSKSDIGDGDKIETNKAAVSDSLKRAAVQWGIGRYLYGLAVSTPEEYKAWLADGTLPGQRPAPQPATRPEPPRRQPPPPTPIRAAPTGGALPITAEQKTRIDELRQQLHWTPAGVQAYLRGHYGGKATRDELTRDEADEMIDDLQAKIAEDEGVTA